VKKRGERAALHPACCLVVARLTLAMPAAFLQRVPCSVSYVEYCFKRAPNPTRRHPEPSSEASSERSPDWALRPALRLGARFGASESLTPVCFGAPFGAPFGTRSGPGSGCDQGREAARQWQPVRWQIGESVVSRCVSTVHCPCAPLCCAASESGWAAGPLLPVAGPLCQWLSRCAPLGWAAGPLLPVAAPLPPLWLGRWAAVPLCRWAPLAGRLSR
jgi:hypothetical protein